MILWSLSLSDITSIAFSPLNESFLTDERFKSSRKNIFFRRTYIFAIYLYMAILTITRDEWSLHAIVENRHNLGFKWGLQKCCCFVSGQVTELHPCLPRRRNGWICRQTWWYGKGHNFSNFCYWPWKENQAANWLKIRGQERLRGQDLP